MEPHWNPMIEAQAAARVDRLDQTKDIRIYRYVVKDSIEDVCHTHVLVRNYCELTLHKEDSKHAKAQDPACGAFFASYRGGYLPGRYQSNLHDSRYHDNGLTQLQGLEIFLQ